MVDQYNLNLWEKIARNPPGFDPLGYFWPHRAVFSSKALVGTGRRMNVAWP
jgi:hypothetical protein